MSTIIPAILTSDQTELEEKLRVCEQLAPAVHLDVADGQFVPNRTLPIRAVLAARTTLARELHLMVTNPLALVAELPTQPASDRLIIHVEALPGPAAATQVASRIGGQISFALNPQTPLGPWLSALAGHPIVLLGVEPGFQGAPFVPATIGRIRAVRTAHPEVEITVDGGIGPATIAAVAAAGADRFVVGSAIWRSPDPAAAYQALRATLKTL